MQCRRSLSQILSHRFGENFPTLQDYRAVLPTNPRPEKITFEFLLRFSEFYFLFSATPTGFLIFCLPADEAMAKSVTNTLPQIRRSKQP